MKRKVHEDGISVYITVDGWVLRPQHPPTQAKVGEFVTVKGGRDPVGRHFGCVVARESGPTERWRIFNSETIESLR